MRNTISDQQWLEVQSDPQKALREYGINLPDLPPDEVRMRFTGRSGSADWQQAFGFYKHISLVCNLRQTAEPRILDFGGGWGRIARLFLKDTKPESIWIADCLSDAIHWLQATKNPCNIIQNEPFPPLPELNTRFHLVYCFSVFSHLSEAYFNAWMESLMDLLLPGGHLVFTSRGEQFIRFLERSDIKTRTKDLLPNVAILRERYLNGEFQFYPTGGGGELSRDFFGEAFIPRPYIERKYGASLIDFNEKVSGVDQSVSILRK